MKKNSNIDPRDYNQIQAKFGDKIKLKNQEIQKIQFLIHQATKSYNDCLRVYEAKLVSLGVPSEDLNFEPLETITSQLPIGINY
jgi:hypothetical protein